VNIFAADEASANRAIHMVTDIAAVAEVGKTYLGKVVRIVDFGAFVEIFPGTDGLLHISEISENRVNQVRDELNEGDQIMVRVLALEGNKIKLSRKAILREQREKLKGTPGELPPLEGGDDTGAPQSDAPRGDRPPRRDGDRPPRRDGDRGRGPRR